jgi:glycosyltransferase involved in cell wall biosynthesis
MRGAEKRRKPVLGYRGRPDHERLRGAVEKLKPGGTEKQVVVFLVNGDAAGAMGIRARSFEQRLREDYDVEIVYRQENKLQAIVQMLRVLTRVRPKLCYVFDMAFSGVIAAALYRSISRCRTIVDTGDSIYELSRLTGSRGPAGLLLTKLLEWLAFHSSDRVVVRSHPHQELLSARSVASDVIPDGVDTRQFFPCPEIELRRKYGLEGYKVIGLLGSLIWSPSLQSCYGWELIELLHLLRDCDVKGVVIGDGSGLGWLKNRCAALGLENRVVFLGRLPYEELPRYLNIMDICLSTQTNDAVGQVRTTGKLPLYLACGLFVLSTDVGEASRVLPPDMRLPYHGTIDRAYPERLAARVRELLQEPDRLEQHSNSVAIAESNFEYNALTLKLRQVFAELIPGTLVPVDKQPSLPVAAENRNGLP